MIKIVFILVLSLIALFLFNGNRQQESVQFTDLHIFSDFENRLSEKRIPFRKDKDWIWYYVKDRKEVEKILNEVQDYYHGPNVTVFKDLLRFEKARTSFVDLGINHYVFTTDKGKGIGWDKTRQKEGTNIIYDALEVSEEIREEIERQSVELSQWTKKKLSGAIINRADLELVKKYLKEENIEHRISDMEDGVSVTWEAKNVEAAMKVISRVEAERLRRNTNE